jgi:signal recognition particle subunit SRP54
MKKMGGLTSLMDKLPAQFAQAAGQLQGGVEERRSSASRASSTP